MPAGQTSLTKSSNVTTCSLNSAGSAALIRSRRGARSAAIAAGSRPNSASTASRVAARAAAARAGSAPASRDSLIGLATRRTRAGEGMGQIDRHAAFADLRIGEHIGEVVDRAARHLGGLERRQPFGARPQLQPRRQQRHEDGPVAHAAGIAGEALVVGQLGAARDGAEAARIARRCRRRGSGGRRRLRTPGTGRCSGGRCRRVAVRRRWRDSRRRGWRASRPGCRAAPCRSPGLGRCGRGGAARPGSPSPRTCR